MKREGVMLGLILLLIGCGDAKVANEGGFQVGSLLVPQVEYSFGEIPVLFPLEHEFAVVNIGNHGVQVQKKASSCDCFVADFRETSLEPKQQLSIPVHYLPRQYGPVAQSLTLVSAEAPETPIILTIRATVLPYVSFSPELVEIQATEDELGEIHQTVLASKNFNAEQSFFFDEVQCSAPYIQASISDITEKPLAQKQLNISVEMNEAPVGKFNELITLTCDRNKLVLPVLITRKGVVMVEPVSISLGILDRGASTTRNLELVGASDGWEVAGVRVGREILRASCRQAGTKLALEFSPTEVTPPGIFKEKLFVTLNKKIPELTCVAAVEVSGTIM